MIKYVTGIRLTPHGKALLVLLAERYGSSQSATMERAIQELARREGVRHPPVPTPTHE